jgi:hypothetical protein
MGPTLKTRGAHPQNKPDNLTSGDCYLTARTATLSQGARFGTHAENMWAHP